MVKQGQALGAGGEGVVDRPLGRRVTPARLLRILRDRVLSVVNDQVCVGEEFDVTLVLAVPGRLPIAPGRGVRGVRLVIHRVDHHVAAGLQAIAEREGRVVQILRGDAHGADREAPLDEIVKTNARPQLREGDGEVVVLHLSGQRPFELLSERPRSIDVPRVPRDEERREKREPLDVIPVGVGDHQMAVAARPARGHQGLSQSVRAGPAVENDQRAIDAPDLHAGRVAAVAQRGWPRLGHGPARTPESDVHAVSPCTSRAPWRPGTDRSTAGWSSPASPSL